MKKKHINTLTIITFLFVAFMNILNVLIGFRAFLKGHFAYSDMLISEWLINYAGGFVRRGLTGQMLLLCYNVRPHDIINTVVFIYIVGLIALVIILMRVFKEEKWSPYITIFPICISISFLGARRDYWALVLVYICFMLYKLYNKRRNITILIAANLICSINILIHEVAFFFMIPILFISTLIINSPTPFHKNIFQSFITWLPSISSFVFVCIFKGNATISASIWDSWSSCFYHYSMADSTPPIGTAVEWLTYDTAYAFKLHIHRFWNSFFIYNVPSWPFNIYTIIATYYLVVNMNTIKLGVWDINNYCKFTLSNILIIQFLFLLPMFGFLSCDFGRIIMYWTTSSIFAYHCFKEYYCKIPLITSISTKAIRLTNRSEWLSRRWLYFIILTTIPVAGSQGSNILSCFAFVPYGWRLAFWDYILETLPIIE
jgi:hypothetical protein